MKKCVTLFTVAALVLSLVFCFYGCEDNIQLTSSSSSSSASLQSVVTSQASYEVSSVISDPTESELSAAHSKYYASLVASREALLYGTGSVTASMPDELPVYIDGSIELTEDKDNFYPLNRKYRKVYYMEPYCDWIQVLGRLRGQNNPGIYEDIHYLDDMVEFSYEQRKIQESGQEREEMRTVTMIKTFNITRDEMESIIEQYIAEYEHREDFNKTEDFEVPNLDIIYTLDNDIINEYYRYA